MSKKFYCKCCFVQTTGVEAFCEDCLEEGVTSFGRDVNPKTGKIVKKPKYKNKFKPTDNEEWISVPSPYKDYRKKS